MEGLTERAAGLSVEARRVLALPAAALVPGPVKGLVSELVALVALLAMKIEALERGEHEKG